MGRTKTYVRQEKTNKVTSPSPGSISWLCDYIYVRVHNSYDNTTGFILYVLLVTQVGQQ